MQIKKTDLKNHLVSTAIISEGVYETMVFCKKINDEIQCVRSEKRFDAFKIHLDFVKQYASNKEAVKIGELIKSANSEAQKFALIDDGGTCNFDAPVINLKGKRSNFIDQIEAVSGFSLSKLSGKYWAGCYIVLINSSGQGSRRTKMAETAKKHLLNAGLDVSMYYQCD